MLTWRHLSSRTISTALSTEAGCRRVTVATGNRRFDVLIAHMPAHCYNGETIIGYWWLGGYHVVPLKRKLCVCFHLQIHRVFRLKKHLRKKILTSSKKSKKEKRKKYHRSLPTSATLHNPLFKKNTKGPHLHLKRYI